MKRILTLLFVLLLHIGANAQKIPYEKLDSVSAVVSNLQSTSENLTYSDGINMYTLSFPEENFKIYFSTGKATKSVYKTTNGEEYLYLTENIDLTKATDMYNTLYPGLAGAYRVKFSEAIQTQIYKNGEYQKTISQDYIEFFFPRGKRHSEQKGKFVYSYYEGDKQKSSIKSAIAAMKIAKGLSPYWWMYNSDFDHDKHKNLKEGYEKWWKESDLLKSRLEILKAEDVLLKNHLSEAVYKNVKAVEFLEKAYSINPLKTINIGFGYISRSLQNALLNQLNQTSSYSRMQELLESPDANFMDLDYHMFLYYKARSMVGNGKCIEAEQFLKEQIESSYNTQTAKLEMKTLLGYLYSNGCKGTSNNVVKKNRKLAKEYQ